MLVPKKQFRDEDAHVTFIGPSGAGKSGRSKQVADEWGCPRFEVDEMIGSSRGLRKVLSSYKGDDAAEKMGRWLGMPWDKRFPEREDAYLVIERDAMRRVIKLAGDQRRAIIDTTGSAIYHPMQLATLQRGSLVVYLAADTQTREELLEKYLEDPKPVCFNGVWSPAEGESHEDTLKRCYPVLLETRHRAYKAFADVTLNASEFKKSAGATVEDFLAAVEEHLPVRV